MNEPTVVTPPAVSAATPTPVTPPITPPVAAALPAPAPTPAPTPTPTLAASDGQVDQNWLKERLSRERLKGIKAAGFDSEEEAKAAAAAAKAAAEAKKTAEERMAEFQQLNTQLKGRADAITALLTEQATDAFNTLTDAQKAAVRLQAADDAPAEDRIKAIKLVRALSASISMAAPVAPVTATPPAAPASAAPTTPVTPSAPAVDTAPGRTQPNGGTGSPPNHRTIYEDLSKTNPFAAARYAAEHPESYKST